jgi:hypothetical protein
VLEEVSTNIFSSADGFELKFTHSYRGTTCAVTVSSRRGSTVIQLLELNIPINRTKTKWKQLSFGTNCELFYRSQFEVVA